MRIFATPPRLPRAKRRAPYGRERAAYAEGATWVPDIANILAADGAAYDEFGNSVSISGDYAVVGANGDDENGSASGSSYVKR